MSVKAKVEAIIYATEDPVTLNQLASLLGETVLAELRAQDEARLALNETISTPSPELLDEADGDADSEAAVPVETASKSSPDIPHEKTTTLQDLSKEQHSEREQDDSKRVKEYLNQVLEELTTEYGKADHGMEIRQIAGGYRMGTKPEHHDVVVGFAKSLKPPVRLSLQALETLAVIAYKQPVTVPEMSEIRGVDCSGVIATLLDRKLITTAGRKQVIGRPILYRTTKEFLMRFGLNSVTELPSMEEFEKLGDPQAGLFPAAPEDAAPASEPPAGGTQEAELQPEPVNAASAGEPAAADLSGQKHDLQQD